MALINQILDENLGMNAVEGAVNTPLKQGSAVLLAPKGALFSYSAISSHLESLGYPLKSLNSMLMCGKMSGQKLIKRCKDCGDFQILDLKHHCNLRTCPTCSQIRQFRIVRKYMPYFSQFPTTRGSPKSLYFLSIAPQNYENLQNGLKHILFSWRKFIRTKYIKERVEGGLWVIETTNNGAGWHIHIHALFYGRRLDNCIRGKCLDCGQNFIKFDKLGNKYFCANKKCNSTNVIINENSKIVNLFKSCSGRDVNIQIRELYGSTKSVLNYVLKYVSANKGDFQSPEQFAQYIFSTRKQKLINMFGTFFKFKPQKTTFLCKKCGGDIEFVYDMELLSMIESRPVVFYGPPDNQFF